MKQIINRLSLIFVFLFVAAMVFVTYYLYIFPDQINKRSILVDQEAIKSLRPVFNELNIIIFAGLLIGLIALMLQLFNQNTSKEDDFVFSEKSKTKIAEKEEEIEETTQTGNNYSLREFEKIIQSGGDQKRMLNKILWAVSKKIDASQAAIYKSITEENDRYIQLVATFAYSVPDSEVIKFEYGEGLAGQVAKEGRVYNISDVPDGYIQVVSGLGNASPNHLLIMPLLKEEEILGVIELASFKMFDKELEEFLGKLCNVIANKLHDDMQVTTAVVEESKSDKI